jgi:hypothetical protein
MVMAGRAIETLHDQQTVDHSLYTDCDAAEMALVDAIDILLVDAGVTRRVRAAIGLAQCCVSAAIATSRV